MRDPKGRAASAKGDAAPAVTVVTPAYNVERYVGEAVDSVLAQSFSDFEHIVVDDGSSDATTDEILIRAKSDPRVQLVCADHGGVSNARNLGILRARGRYIAFLDGDDRWRPEFLRSQLELLESVGPDVAAVFARSRVMSETGRIYMLRWQRSGRYDFEDMLIQACPPRTGSSLLVRKEAFDSAGLFDVNLISVEDLEMWLRIQLKSGMPYFWGNSKYLIDLRVRPGARSRNLRRRFVGQDSLLSEASPLLSRNPAGMAYVRPAVFAFRAEEDDFAQRWLRLARTAGLRRLLADSYGRRMLVWGMLSPRQRRLLRGVNMSLRVLLGRIIGASGGILR